MPLVSMEPLTFIHASETALSTLAGTLGYADRQTLNVDRKTAVHSEAGSSMEPGPLENQPGAGQPREQGQLQWLDTSLGMGQDQDMGLGEGLAWWGHGWAEQACGELETGNSEAGADGPEETRGALGRVREPQCASMQSWLWLGWGDLTTGATRAISALLALTWPPSPHGSQGAMCKTRSKEKDFSHKKHWYNLSPHFFHDPSFQVIFKNVAQHRSCWSPTDNTLLLWELNMPSHHFGFCPLTSCLSARGSFPDHLTSPRGIHESPAELL